MLALVHLNESIPLNYSFMPILNSIDKYRYFALFRLYRISRLTSVSFLCDHGYFKDRCHHEQFKYRRMLPKFVAPIYDEPHRHRLGG